MCVLHDELNLEGLFIFFGKRAEYHNQLKSAFVSSIQGQELFEPVASEQAQVIFLLHTRISQCDTRLPVGFIVRHPLHPYCKGIFHAFRHQSLPQTCDTNPTKLFIFSMMDSFAHLITSQKTHPAHPPIRWSCHSRILSIAWAMVKVLKKLKQPLYTLLRNSSSAMRIMFKSIHGLSSWCHQPVLNKRQVKRFVLSKRPMLFIPRKPPG